MPPAPHLAQLETPLATVPPPGRAGEGECGDHLLAGIRLLRSLDRDSLSAIERTCVYRRFAPLEQIIDRDARTTEVFFIVRGRARIVNYSVTGREIAFDDLKEGDHFGELAALGGGGPRSANVMALAECLILALPQRTFRGVLERHPAIALEVMARLVRIVRAAAERIMDLSTLAAQNRVQAELLRQVRGREPDANCGRISPIPVHSEIASRVQHDAGDGRARAQRPGPARHRRADQAGADHPRYRDP